jgi:hypothetical protein
MHVLTKDIIETTPTPTNGEVWLADKTVKGFGVRIWCNRSGARGMSYAVRVKDWRRKWVRRTIRFETLLGFRLSFLARYTGSDTEFYELLSVAREAAREEIARIKRKMTPFEQKLATQEALQKVQLEQSCKQAFDALVQKAKLEGRSVEYVQRLNKVFYQYFPKALLEKKLGEVSADDLTPIFSNTAIPVSSFKILRMVAGQLFAVSRLVSRSRLRTVTNKVVGYIKMAELRTPIQSIPRFSDCKDMVFNRLGKETEYKVDSLCLNVYFATLGSGVPLSAVIGGKWANIWCVAQPTFKRHSEMYWLYNPVKPLKRVNFTNEFATLLLEVLVSTNDASFWFPLNEKGQKMSFTRLARYWRRVTGELGLPAATPVQYMREWNEVHNIGDETLAVIGGRWKASSEWRELYHCLFKNADFTV